MPKERQCKMINVEQLHPEFITDEKGQRKSVILPITDFQELINDLEDLAVVAERRGEPTTSHANFVNELKSSGIL
ncbi:MAG: hypothetical protein R8M38_05560 [Mariprofundaceae bacterium]